MGNVKLFFDMEFTGLHQKTTPISLGVVSENNRTFYAEFTDYDVNQVDSWINANVIEHLILKDLSIPQIAEKNTYNQVYYKGNKDAVAHRFLRWLKDLGHTKYEFWGDCLSYDWVLFTQLFGGALNIPNNIYYIPYDISSLLKLMNMDPDITRERVVIEHEGKLKKMGYNQTQTIALAKEISAKHNSLYDALVIKMWHDLLCRKLEGLRWD